MNLERLHMVEILTQLRKMCTCAYKQGCSQNFVTTEVYDARAENVAPYEMNEG